MSATITKPIFGAHGFDEMPGQSAGHKVLTPRILTTHPKGFYPLWSERTILLPGWLDEARRAESSSLGSWQSFRWGWKLFRSSKNFTAVVTGFERPWHIFALTRSLLRREKPRHILVFVDFTLPTSSFGRRLKLWYYRRIISSVEHVIVFSRRQIETYVQVLGVPVEKFVCVPYHTTIDGYSTGGRTPQFCVSDGNYIFAGGDSNRDYATLIEAARHLPNRVVIAVRSRSHFRDLNVPANVEIVTVEPEHFLRLMAGAKVVVVPLHGGLGQAGQQTYLNAMAMGKPVVVADDAGADEYITQGLSGLVVPPGDPALLREALLKVLGDRDLAQRMGRAAQAAAANFSLERFIKTLLEIVEQEGSAVA